MCCCYYTAMDAFVLLHVARSQHLELGLLVHATDFACNTREFSSYIITLCRDLRYLSPQGVELVPAFGPCLLLLCEFCLKLLDSHLQFPHLVMKVAERHLRRLGFGFCIRSSGQYAGCCIVLR